MVEKKMGLSNEILDIIINSYWDFITDHKLDYVNMDRSFIRYSKKGKLIIDLNDLNACNTFEKNYEFIQVLNNLKNQDNKLE